MELKHVIRNRRQARWVKSARRGDGQAMARLYDELYPAVADYLDRRLASSHDAEDLVSEVFHRLLKNLERYDPRRGSVLGWVMTMTRHALIDHLRRGRDTVSVDALADELAGDLPDPLEGLIRTDQANRVLEALAELPPATREIVSLHYGQELRLRDIGNVLELSEAAVKQRLSRARRELRERLRVQEDRPETGRPAAVRRWACLDDRG